MGASTEDVNLIIICKGETQYWSGMKACGNVILDIRFGLYSQSCTPDLSWIKKTIWEEILLPLDAPMEHPIYGDLIVDFDKRVITERTGWGSPLRIMRQWLSITWEDPREAPVSKKSLIEHLKNNRVRALRRHEMLQAGRVGLVLDKNLKKAIQELEELAKTEYSFMVDFDLPEGWQLDEGE